MNENNRYPEWKEENNLNILYLEHPEERYIIDTENKDIRKEYYLMGKWEESNFSFSVFPPTLTETKELIETDIENQEIAEKEFMDEMMNEVWVEMDKYTEERDSWKKELKGLINTKRLWEDMEEFNDYWSILGMVDIELTEEQKHGYPRHQCARIKDDDCKHLYMKTNSDVKYINHYYVWQTTGYLGDDYSGFVLYPLKNERYLKISYSC